MPVSMQVMAEKSLILKCVK